MNRPKKTGLSRAEQLARLPQGFVCAIDDFSAYLKMELGRGPNTVSSYIGDVLQFCQSAVAEGKTSFLDVDADTISDWISDISKRVKTTTQSRKLSALATLANFLIDEGIWDKNFSRLVARPKVVRSQPEVLEAGQIDDIINAPDGGSAESARDRAMLELAYSSGLRVSELCNLRARKGQGGKDAPCARRGSRNRGHKRLPGAQGRASKRRNMPRAFRDAPRKEDVAQDVLV